MTKPSDIHLFAALNSKINEAQRLFEARRSASASRSSNVLVDGTNQDFDASGSGSASETTGSSYTPNSNLP